MGSPHLFLPDGTDVANPGVSMRPVVKGEDFPRVERDDPAIDDDIVRRAMGEQRVA